jgi:hypothetical protein
MSRKFSACLAIGCALVAQISIAAPILTVNELGPTPQGDRLWIAQVAPDPALLPGSMAVELAFAIDHADLIGVDVQSAIWDTANPGNNPFTGTVTDGLWVDLIGDRTFGAFGSIVLNSAAPVDLFLFETSGLGLTTIRYGAAASVSSTLGARITMGGQNFDNYSGSVTAVPEPAAAFLLAFSIPVAMGVGRRDRAA